MIYTIQINEEEKSLITSGLEEYLLLLQNNDCPEWHRQVRQSESNALRDNIKKVQKMLEQLKQAK